MDGIGTLIFLILAAVLSGLSSKAKKKANEEAARKKQQPTSPKPSPDQAIEEMLKRMMGEEPSPQPTVETEKEYQETGYNEVEEQTVPETFAKAEPVEPSPVPASIEYEIPTEPVKEESLYPNIEFKPLDSIDNITGYSYEQPTNNIEEYDYNLDIAEDSANAISSPIAQGEICDSKPSENIVENFDPVKAIIYSEIITPKYI